MSKGWVVIQLHLLLLQQGMSSHPVASSSTSARDGHSSSCICFYFSKGWAVIQLHLLLLQQGMGIHPVASASTSARDEHSSSCICFYFSKEWAVIQLHLLLLHSWEIHGATPQLKHIKAFFFSYCPRVNHSLQVAEAGGNCQWWWCQVGRMWPCGSWSEEREGGREDEGWNPAVWRKWEKSAGCVGDGKLRVDGGSVMCFRSLHGMPGMNILDKGFRQ